MKKSIKTILLVTSCFVLLAVAFGFVFSANMVAVAENPLITTVPGAAVMLPEATEGGYTNGGIRFSSVIDKAQYDALVANGTVETGMFIIPWNAYAQNEANEENLITNPKYYWQTGVDEDGNPVFSSEETADKTLVFRSDCQPVVNDESSYRINGFVTDLDDVYMRNVSFVGVGYVKATASDGAVTYTFAATSESNARSLALVAQKLYYKADATTADGTSLSSSDRTEIAQAYVQKYIDLYKAANGKNPTVSYESTAMVETKNGFERTEVTLSAELSSIDATIPGTEIPAMLDGSSKGGVRYVYNNNATAESISLSEDDLFAIGTYTPEEGVVTKSSDWSVDGTSLRIDFTKTTSSWHGFNGSAISVAPGRYVSFVAYSESEYPVFGGSSFWIDGSASVEKVFTLEPGVPKRVEFDLGQAFSSIKAFAFQKNPYADDDCVIYIDDVRIFNKTVQVVDTSYVTTEQVPVNPISVSEDNILSIGEMYKGSEGAVTKSTEWSVDGKSESLCFDFSKRTENYWMGVTGSAYSWGENTSYISFVAYCAEDYDTPNNAFWIKTVGGERDVDFSLKGGIAKRIIVPVTGSGVSLFTFQYSSVNEDCKLFIDDIIVYSTTEEKTVSVADSTDMIFAGDRYMYQGSNSEASVTKSNAWSVDGGESLLFDFSASTFEGGEWMGVSLNEYGLGKTYGYVSFTAYADKDYSSTVWISNQGQESTVYKPIALQAGKATTFEFPFNANKLTLFTFGVPADKSCKLYVDNIKFYDAKAEVLGDDPGLYTQTISAADKATVIAGFTSLITDASKDVTLVVSCQTSADGAWTQIASESTKCALNAVVDLSDKTYCKVKVEAIVDGKVVATQILDLFAKAE